MKAILALAAAAVTVYSSVFPALASEYSPAVGDKVVEEQRAALDAATRGKGFGPQAPRDIGMYKGSNHRSFGVAPDVKHMNLCDIHFHENAEHKGGEFTTYAGNGDGHGYGTGFKYNGTLTAAELAPIDHKVGATEHGDLQPGDTIEVHYVYTTTDVVPGPTLKSCLTDAIFNPQLRVESVVAVLVNDKKAADFRELAKVEKVGGFYQAPNLPDTLGTPVQYAGSTTGPGYNEKASPFQVSWSVRPNVIKVDIDSVGAWLADNPFKENHAHGVRNLVVNPDLLSPISH